MRRKLIALVVACGLAASSLIAQARPDFNGKWTTTMAGSIDRPTTMTVRQDSSILTGELDLPAGKQTWSFKLDGSESRNTTSANGEVVSTVKWEGEKLVISTPLRPTPEGEFTLVQTWSLEEGKLVIRSSQVNRATGTPTRTVIQTYTK
jgi:hypothetical protein